MKKLEIILFCLTLFSAFGYVHILSYEYSNFEYKNLEKIEEIPIFIFSNDEFSCAKKFDNEYWLRNTLIEEEFASISEINSDFLDDSMHCGDINIWCEYTKYFSDCDPKRLIHEIYDIKN